MRDILGGAKGPKTDVVLLNAGAAIYTATEGISFEEGIAIAIEVRECGGALEQLEKFRGILCGDNVFCVKCCDRSCIDTILRVKS